MLSTPSPSVPGAGYKWLVVQIRPATAVASRPLHLDSRSESGLPRSLPFGLFFCIQLRFWSITCVSSHCFQLNTRLTFRSWNFVGHLNNSCSSVHDPTLALRLDLTMHGRKDEAESRDQEIAYWKKTQRAPLF